MRLKLVQVVGDNEDTWHIEWPGTAYSKVLRSLRVVVLDSVETFGKSR